LFARQPVRNIFALLVLDNRAFLFYCELLAVHDNVFVFLCFFML
jgi:hypothetical protein